MIEVEAKFVLTAQTKTALLDGADFIGTKEFIVEFWDNAQWDLGLKNLALKRKTEHFELKAPTSSVRDGSSYSTIMDEISDEDEIRRRIDIQKLSDDLTADLLKQGFTPRATIHTVRQSYRKQGFIIDLDEAIFPLLKTNGNYHYEIAEIELQVANDSDTAEAHKQIGEFAKKHGLTLANTRGKHMEFIFQNYPEHYQNLIKAGVMDK